ELFHAAEEQADGIGSVHVLLDCLMPQGRISVAAAVRDGRMPHNTAMAAAVGRRASLGFDLEWRPPPGVHVREPVFRRPVPHRQPTTRLGHDVRVGRQRDHRPLYSGDSRFGGIRPAAAKAARTRSVPTNPGARATTVTWWGCSSRAIPKAMRFIGDGVSGP